MSLLSRAAETYVPLATLCADIGYPPDRVGQRNLRRQIRRKGFEVRRVGNAFSVQVSVWTAYLQRCAQDSARHRTTIGAQSKARWATRREAREPGPPLWRP
jgi:hypothetical protein